MWQTDFSCPVIFVPIWRKTGLFEVGFDVEFGVFLRNIEDSEYISLWKFTRNRNFYHPLLRNLEGKSCNSLVWTRSSLDRAPQRRNCSLNTQKQPLFWDKSNKNLTTRHLRSCLISGQNLSKNWRQKIGVCHTLGLTPIWLALNSYMAEDTEGVWATLVAKFQLGRWSQVPSWMPRNRKNERIFEPIFQPQFDGFCVKIIYKITTFWITRQQFTDYTPCTP